MSRTRAQFIQAQTHTEAARDLLSVVEEGRLIWNATTNRLQTFDGLQWIDILNSSDPVPGTLLSTSVDSSLLTGDIDGGIY